MRDGRFKVGVVLVHWNNLADTEACLESLARLAPRVPLSVIVVDNASEDGSAEALASRTGLTLLKNTENAGFAAAANAGIRRALEEGAGAVLLLNNDTLVEPGFLASIAAELDDPAVGIVGCRIERVRPAGEVWFDGGWTDLSLGRAHHRPPDGVSPERPCDVGFVTGCAMLVRREVFDKVGLLSEGYFMYGEDNDFCLRAGRAGWRLRFVPGARIFHKVSGSGADSRTPLGAYLSARNRVLLARRFGSSIDRLKFPFRYGWEMLTRILRALRRGKGGVILPTLAGALAGIVAPLGDGGSYRPPSWVLRRQALHRARRAGRVA